MSKPAAVPADEYDVTSSLLQLMWALRQDAARTFDPLGFRTMQTLLLGFVERGYTQPKELAERLGTVPPAVSALITDLETRGLLAREGDPSDGRRVRLPVDKRRRRGAGRTARLVAADEPEASGRAEPS